MAFMENCADLNFKNTHLYLCMTKIQKIKFKFILLICFFIKIMIHGKNNINGSEQS